MSQYGFYFNGSRCTGCKTCTMACKDYHDLGADVSLRNVMEYAGGAWTQDEVSGLWGNTVFAYYVSVACNHCDNPACLSACPQGAISKDPDTGFVTRDEEACIGCGACVTACPYDAPRVDEEKGKSVKCDGCASRVAAGLQPVCVEACPLRALEFGDIEDLRAKYGDVADLAPLPDSSETGPNLVVGVPAHGLPAEGVEGSLANEREL